MFANNLIGLSSIELTEPNPPEKEGHEYGYAMFEQLVDIQIDSSKHTYITHADICNITATIDNTEIHLSISTKVIIDRPKWWPFLYYYIEVN